MSRIRGAIFIVALVALLAASLATGWRLVVQILSLRAERRVVLLEPPLDFRGAVLMADGIDQHGRVLDQMPPRTRRMVAFALVGRGFGTEIAFWGRVRAMEGPSTFMVGICGDSACASRARLCGAGFPVLVDGEVVGILAALQAYRSGDFLLTDSRARILAEPPLTGRSAAAVVAEIGTAR